MKNVGKYVTDLVLFSNQRKFKNFCEKIKNHNSDDIGEMITAYKETFSAELDALADYIDKINTNLEEQIKYGTKVTILTKEK